MEDALVMASGLEFYRIHAIWAGPLHAVHPLRVLASLLKLSLGSAQALFRLLTLRPQVVLLTGGWANLPVALAAKALRIPIVIFLPDIEPGLAIKALRRFATAVALTVGESARHFPPGKTVVTGYPLQEDRLCAGRYEARARFGLEAERKTLLVFGGSRGARNINIALAQQLARLLEQGLQIIHVTGELDWERTINQVGELADHSYYHPFAYLHGDMGLALAAADLALCRAGASALAELPLFGLPAILVPYPFAWRYQKVNADYLSERGAAIRLNDEDMAAELYQLIISLITDEERLAEMRVQALALANPKGAAELAELLLRTGRR